MSTPQTPPTKPNSTPVSLAGRIGMGMFLLGVTLFIICLATEFIGALFR